MTETKSNEIRINKYIRECGIASRREADSFIENGRVKINGIPAVSGQKVLPGDVVTLDGKEIKPVQKKHVVAFYKPAGVVCTAKDENADVILDDVFHYPVKLTYAGRLDKDSEGLLIMTDDGELIDRMMRSRNGHEKEYEVTLRNPVTDDFIRRFEEGVYIKELDVTTRPCTVKRMGDKKVCVILTQGLNRQIRRTSKILGNNVVKLKRTRVVNITLGDLKPGEFRELTEEEIGKLRMKLEM